MNSKKIAKDFPQWRIFAKSGHTAIKELLSYVGSEFVTMANDA